MSKQKQRPEVTFRIGSISASVFVNKTDAGERRNVTLQRSYRDGDEWKSTTSFGLGDLPTAIAVLQRAFDHVADKEITVDGNG